MNDYPEKILFLTQRSLRHQAAAIAAAPSGWTIHMLRNPTQQEVLAQIADASYLISERSGQIDRAMIEAGQKLRLIQRLGSLAYDIDVAAATEAGIPVCVWPLRGSILVAEHMLMQILALAKRLPDALATIEQSRVGGQESARTDEDTFAYNWSGRSGVADLYDKEIGIVGFGEIGVEFARRLVGFQCKLWYYKRHRLPTQVEQMLDVAYTEPGELYARCDYVCSLLPYSLHTDLLLDANVFAQMKRGAFLISCGSGSVVDEDALADAIESGHLAGAALDTFEWEPLPSDHRLVQLARDAGRNLLLTPHIAAGTDERDRNEEYLNVLRVRAGQPPFYWINDPKTMIPDTQA